MPESPNEWCRDMETTVEKVELLMLTEYLMIVETQWSIKNQPDNISSLLPPADPHCLVHHTVNYLDPQKVERFYPHVARVLWLKPNQVDCRLYMAHLQFILKGETEAELEARRRNIARHLEGIEAAVQIVYRAMDVDRGFPPMPCL
nr:TPA_asm: hypothetical protein [Strongylocentrotus sea urchin adintovirus]